MSIRSQVVIDEQHPWPGLSAFDEASERFFNGRAAESAELRRIVMQAPLAVLFGVSGLGKSSLLQAGLFPLLRRENMLPVLIRLDFNDRSGAPLIDQARAALQREIEARSVEAPAFEPGESLWEYLHRADLELWSQQNQPLTPVFVIDQFEEVFTLGADAKVAVKELKNDLANLVENRLPATLAARAQGEEDTGRYALDSQRYRFLLSFREDFLAAIEGWKREMPSILKNRLRLLPMSGKQALRAIHDTAPHLTTDALAGTIMVFVAQARASDETSTSETLRGESELSVEPSLLSLVCHGLNEKRLLAHKTVIDQTLLDETGPSIVSDFYRGAVDDQPARVRRFIETELITERGFRKPCDVDDASRKYGVTTQEITSLVARRLVRIEPVRGSDRVELTHDLLTGVVREHRDRERERLRRRRRSAGALIAGGIMAVAFVGYASYHEYEDGVLQREERHNDSVRVQFYADSLRNVASSDSLHMQTKSRDSLELLTNQLIVQQQATRRSADGLQRILTDQRGAQVARATMLPYVSAVQRYDSLLRVHAIDSLALVFSDSLATSSLELDVMQYYTRSVDLKAGHGVAIAAVLSAHGDTIPFDAYSHLDLFDVRGAQPPRLSPADSFARPMFGDSVRSPEPALQPAFFTLPKAQDSAVVEWSTARDIELRSVALFAQHDGVDGALPPSNAARAFFFAKLDVMIHAPGRTDSAWLTVADYRQPPVPYATSEAWGDDQPGRSLSICLPMGAGGNVPVAGHRFRLTIARPPTSNWGPRIVELDGYSENSCGFAPRAIDDVFAPGSKEPFARRYARSTIAIAMVLGALVTNSEYPPSGTGADSLAAALRFLSHTDVAAWNQQLVRHAGYVLRRNPRAVDGEALWPLLRRIVPRVDSIVAIDLAADSAAALIAQAKSDAVADEQLLAKLDAFALAHPFPAGAPRAALRELSKITIGVRRLDSLRRVASATLEDSKTSLNARDLALQEYRAQLAAVRGGHSLQRRWAVGQHMRIKSQLAREARQRFGALALRARLVVDDSARSLADKIAILDSARLEYADAGRSVGTADFNRDTVMWVMDRHTRLQALASQQLQDRVFPREPVTGLDAMSVLASSGSRVFTFEHVAGERWIMRDADGQPMTFLQEYQRQQGNVFLNDLCAQKTYWQLSTALRQVNHFSNLGGPTLAAWLMVRADRTQPKPVMQAGATDTVRPANGLDVKHIRVAAGKAELTLDEDCPKRWTVRTADGTTIAQLDEYQRYEGTVLLNEAGASGTYWQFNLAQRVVTRVSGVTGKVLDTYRMTRSAR